MSFAEDMVNMVKKIADACADENEFANFCEQAMWENGWYKIMGTEKFKSTLKIPELPGAGASLIREGDMAGLVTDIFTTRGWTLGKLAYKGQHLDGSEAPQATDMNTVRRKYFSKMLVTLRNGMMSNLYPATNRAEGQSLTAPHENSVTATALPDSKYTVLELKGETSNGWGNHSAVSKRIINFIDGGLARKPSERLAQISAAQASEWFAEAVNESGGSCLVGVMVADLTNKMGQVTRLISLSGNMCGDRGGYEAQTKSKQGSQIHMEQFHFERLAQYINHVTQSPEGALVSADIGILGLKTNDVVSENDMCDACKGTRAREIDSLSPAKIPTITLNVNFLQAR